MGELMAAFSYSSRLALAIRGKRRLRPDAETTTWSRSILPICSFFHSIARVNIWAWLSEGAHFYVCGAVRMGQDVERTLVDVVAAHGGRTTDQAVAYLADLKKRGRYQADVY